MNRNKAYSKPLAMLLAIAMIFTIMPVAAGAAAEDYHSGDVAVINAIIDNNGLSATKDAPGTWDFATWDESIPKRVTDLYLSDCGLYGSLDLSGLTELEMLLCSDNHIIALNVTGDTKLERLHCQYNDMPLPDNEEEYEPREAPGITGMNTVVAWNTGNIYGIPPEWPDSTGEGNDPFYYYPQNITFDVSEITGVTPPVVGETPVREIGEDAYKLYIAAITWSPTVETTFAYGTVYTATITLAVNPGMGAYTFYGVPENFFTVEGATSVTNPANSGVITAVFPMTESEGGPVSGDATLRSLTVSEGTLTPAFQPDTESYTVTVANTVTSINITALSGSVKAAVAGAGTKTLSVGENPFNIVVTAEDQSTKTYTITITREGDANLQSLTVSEGTLFPAFSAYTTNYAVTVAYGIDSINIAAEPNDANASVSGAGTKSLAVGANPIDIIVTAEAGGTKTYRVTVTREALAPVVITGEKARTVTEGEGGSLRLVASGTQPITWSGVNLPNGFTLDGDLITVSPDVQIGNNPYWVYDFTIRSSNPVGELEHDIRIIVTAQPVVHSISIDSDTGISAKAARVQYKHSLYSMNYWTLTYAGTSAPAFNHALPSADNFWVRTDDENPDAETPSGVRLEVAAGSFGGNLLSPNTTYDVWVVSFVDKLPGGYTEARKVATFTTQGPPFFNGSSQLPAGIVGQPYAAAFQIEGTRPFTWSLTEDSAPLPDGLTLGDGLISGTPTAAGDYTFNVTATNEYNPSNVPGFDGPQGVTDGTASQTFKLTIGAGGGEATVTGVSVNPDSELVRKGTTRQFSAAVAGAGSPSQDVIWTVEGGVAGTSIAPDGTLAVDSAETATLLVVKATSVADGTKSGTALVTVRGDTRTPFHLHVETPGTLVQEFTKLYGAPTKPKLDTLQRAMRVTGTINADDLNAIWNCSDLDHAFKDYIEYLDLSGAALDGMTAFPQGQFAGSPLEEILLPNGILAVGDNAFQSCAALTTVSLPDTLTSVGNFAFSGCASLKSIDLSACTGMTSISNGAFHNCSGLESIILPESLTSIGNSAVFTGCTGLSEIHFPAGFSTFKLTAAFSSAGSQPNFDGLEVHLHNPDVVVGVDEMTFLNAVNIKIYVPAQLIDEYAADSDWQYWTQTVWNVALVFENAQRPIITTHPQGGAIIQGQTHTMNVAANVLDGGSLSYQWYKDGQAIGGATDESYTTPSSLPLGSHTYHVAITNTNNDAVVGKTTAATSNTATVTVNTVPTYAVSVVSAGGGATGSGNYEQDATVTISAGTPPIGMRFKEWTTTSVGVTFADSTGATTTFSMPGNAVTVTANFETIPPTVSSVTVNPATVTVQKGTTYQFSATVSGTNNPGQSVTWSVSPNTNGSSITADGALTVGAGESAATLTVTATSIVDGSKSGAATVAVSDTAPPAPTVTSVTVAPASVTLNKGDDYTFSATVEGANNPGQGVIWMVEGGIAGTTMTDGKLKVAATETASTLTVRATSTVDNTKSGTATVTVTQPVTTYTITFNANGGAPATQTRQTGVDGKLASLPTSTRSGYSFNGWYTAASGGAKIDTNYVFTGDTTVFAQWTDASSGNNNNTGGGGGAPNVIENKITGAASWNGITDKAGELKDGESITIDMNGTANVPESFLEAISGKDVEVAFDMGGGLTWTVNGQDIPADWNGGLNLGVSEGGEYIPAAVRGIDGSISEIQLRLSHDGPFGIKLTLNAKLDVQNRGYIANLFYFNAETGDLEFRAAAVIGADGAVELPFDHASDYLIVVAETSMAPTAWQNPFSDVKESDWFYGDVAYAVQNGLFTGTGATTFSPQTPMTRAMLVTVLYRMEGEPAVTAGNPFTDVPAGTWYTDAVIWAAHNEIVSGYGGGLFGPDDYITREQMAVILTRYAEAMDIDLPKTASAITFADNGEISSWAKDAVTAMQRAEMINGKPGNLFDPKAGATRAEVAAVLHRFMEAVK